MMMGSESFSYTVCVGARLVCIVRTQTLPQCLFFANPVSVAPSTVAPKSLPSPQLGIEKRILTWRRFYRIDNKTKTKNRKRY